MRGISFIAASLLACNGGGANDAGFGSTRPSGTSVSTDGSGDATGGTGEAPTTGAGAGGTGTGGGSEDGPSGPPAGCVHKKLDFLFVLSSSWDMQLYQARLLTALPGVLDALAARFPGYDVQFMAIDAESIWSMQDCTWCQADCNKNALPPDCGAAVHPCDKTLGAGLTYPAGNGATNHRCPFAGGRRYITSEEPDVLEALKCVARVGHGGGLSMPGDAMIAAVGALNEPGGCNAGFVRDDALLFIASVEHIYDTLSVRPVVLWTHALLEAKHGDADAIFALALSADFDALDGSVCGAKPDWDFPNPQRTWVESLPHGRFESICIDDYVPVFDASLAAFAETCADD